MEAVDSEKALGKVLQTARQAAGLTQQQLCQRADLSYSTLAKIERGAIKSPSIFTIQSIATALGTTLNDLLGVPTATTPAQSKLQSKSGVRFVYFDINGCLVRFFHGAFALMADDTGAAAELIENTFWHYNDLVCRGDMNMDDFNKAFAHKLGVDNVNWADYYLEAIEPIEEMRDLVTWAAQRYHVGLLSNIMPGLIDTMLKEGVLPNVPYDQIIDSSQVGAIKPEAEIYEIAQGKAGVPAEEILLVDDARPNLMAAERQGWHVMWFDDYRPTQSVDRLRAALEPATL